MKIAQAGNTENPAVLVLLSKGYTISCRIYPPGSPDEPGGNYGAQFELVAEKDGNTFMARDGPALLGIVMIGELRGPNWQTRFDEGETFFDPPHRKDCPCCRSKTAGGENSDPGPDRSCWNLSEP